MVDDGKFTEEHVPLPRTISNPSRQWKPVPERAARFKKLNDARAQELQEKQEEADQERRELQAMAEEDRRACAQRGEEWARQSPGARARRKEVRADCMTRALRAELADLAQRAITAVKGFSSLQY